MTVSKNIGVMGGMFDPVHYGHLCTARDVRISLELDEMRLVPCSSPVHRELPVAEAGQRVDMLQLGVSEFEKFVVDTRECERQGASYTIDTLDSLRRENPDCRLFFLLGTDAFNTLTSWHRWKGLFELCHLVILVRPGWKLEADELLEQEYRRRLVKSAASLKQNGSGNILQFNVTPLEVSSSAIRQEIGAGNISGNLLPDTVLDYIRRHNLYV